MPAGRDLLPRDRRAPGPTGGLWHTRKTVDTGWYLDGIVSSGTKEPMWGRFDRGLTAEYPREINVAKKHSEKATGFIMLDWENCDGAVYHYQDGTKHQPRSLVKKGAGPGRFALSHARIYFGLRRQF